MQNGTLSGLTILIVEDEPFLRKQFGAFLEKLGAEVIMVDTIDKARKSLEQLSFDFVLLDVNLPDGTGTDLLRDNAFPTNTGVIVMTAQGGVDGAVEAMRLGALDYLVKPFDASELPLAIGRVRKTKQSERIAEHRSKSRDEDAFFFGAALTPMEAQLEKILAADKRLETNLPPVLIIGETGTGKTTIARWLHRHGPRASQALVEINCSALPDTLAESELFGHERGAFTDARAGRIGLFEAADGGTLFLDELPSLSSPLQAKVLKAIEDQKIRRIGGNKEIPINIRIIAATNRDLKTLVTKGEFREDLYHRLDLFRISIPPLRQRGGDILKLAERMTRRLCERHRSAEKAISEVGKKRLMAYAWPGNVRELAHELERAIVFEDADQLNFENLAGVQSAATEEGAGSQNAPAGGEWFNAGYTYPTEGFSLDSAINHLIQHALKQTKSNVSAAARLLGVSRDYIRYRLAGNKTGPGDGQGGDSGLATEPN
jgi:two-component system response regulator AtoC